MWAGHPLTLFCHPQGRWERGRTGWVPRTASSERWCGRGVRGVGTCGGREGGGGSAVPGHGCPIRAPCPSDGGEWRGGDARGRAWRCPQLSHPKGLCSHCRTTASAPRMHPHCLLCSSLSRHHLPAAVLAALAPCAPSAPCPDPGVPGPGALHKALCLAEELSVGPCPIPSRRGLFIPVMLTPCELPCGVPTPRSSAGSTDVPQKGRSGAGPCWSPCLSSL